MLEVGCGTGLILDRLRGFARSAAGIDLSAGMLARAVGRGLAVAQASATALPFPDASVDVAYSFKVLAHIPPIAEALAEMARVVRPGGWVLAEFYSARSIRGWSRRSSRRRWCPTPPTTRRCSLLRHVRRDPRLPAADAALG